MPPKKKQNGYQMAEYINNGTTIRDAHKREWVVGDPVGKGGFGMIYLCDQKGNKNDLDHARYVIKIEPKCNGPLFTEINYYQRNCKESDIDKFAKQKKLKILGIPKFMSAGIHTYNGNDLRYLIMPRFGRDLQKLFEENGKKFERELIAQIATKMMYAIEYMHDRRYAHADIKGANILLGNEIKASEREELFLIDFGLAYLVPKTVKHNPDPRCKHDGTIEYCSTDAHDGSKASFRGDIEILAWCLIHWAAGELPWLKLVKENMTMADKEKVAQQKRDAVKSPKQFLAKLGLSGFGELEKLLSYRKKLEYEDEVDFDTCRGYFKSVLPKGTKLSFKKVKSRKSFIKVDSLPPLRNELPVSTPNKKAAKSFKQRTLREETSSEESMKPVRKRTTRREAEPKKEIKKEQSTINTTTRSTRSTRATRRAPPPIEESTVESESEEVDTEITFNTRSTRKNAQSTIRKLVVEDSSEDEESEFDCSQASQSEFFDDEAEENDENEEPSTATNMTKEESAALLGLDNTSTEMEESSEEVRSPLKRVNKLNTTVNHPKRHKVMMQPGKLKNPVTVETQTVRRNGKIKSWCYENKEGFKALREYLKS